MAIAVVVTLALGWFAWRSLSQQKEIEQQRSAMRLQTAADAIAAGMRGRLAETGERLSAWLSRRSAPPAIEMSVVVSRASSHVELTPPGGLPFVPGVSSEPTTDPQLAAIESIEFQSANPDAAIGRYRSLTRHPDPIVRGRALLRLGRMLRSRGDWAASLEASEALSALGSIDVDGYPAELAGLDGQRLSRKGVGDTSGEQRVAGQIEQYLDSGRWLLPRSVAEFYRDEVGRTPKPPSWTLAEGLWRAWDDWAGRPPDRAARIVDVGGRHVLTVLRADSDAWVAAVSDAEAFLRDVGTSGAAYQLTDAEGNVLAGPVAPASEAVTPVTRVVGSAQAPWTLRVWSTEAPAAGRGSLTTLVALMSAAAICLWGTVYLMARAIRREAAVGRLQSEFVAAVSHEFRSPLTTLRQLAEMLDMGSVATEDRRRTYYGLLATEARRLQRLVETLLDFGRMEAGAERYRMEALDVAALVRDVAADVSRTAIDRGTQIEVTGPERVQTVLGDADAMALAVRNVIDNAVKYSPGSGTVKVELGSTDDRVSIRVIDRGIGIDRSEQDAIFRKFVRGRAALAGNVKGTGVGLAMVQHILTAHGGEILVESEPGQGSTFTLLLPCAA